MDGSETAATLRAAALGKSVPVIAMSAHVFKAEIDRFLSSGMDGFISKPLTPESLLGGIDTVLKRAGAGRAGGQAASIGRDIEALGAGTVTKILDAAETVLPQRFAAMRECLPLGQFKRIEKLAHATCSSAASAGFETLLADARTLEAMAMAGNSGAIAAQIAPA